jgi:NhaP-type Na+/H+ or K+/H+ antiporter
MIFQLAAWLLLALLAGKVARLLGMPALVGMLFLGILFGRYSPELWMHPLGLSSLQSLAVSPDLLAMSSDFRTLALVVILLRAGLGIRRREIVQVGRPAILMSFLPALFEASVLTLLIHHFLSWTWLESLLLSCVLAAVSPAVIVPRMLNLLKEGLGKVEAVPLVILASASLDDLLAIICFGLVLNELMGQGQMVLFGHVWLDGVVFSCVGLALGAALGWGSSRLIIYFRRHLKKTKLMKGLAMGDLEWSLLILCISLLIYSVKSIFLLPICSLLGIMLLGFMLLESDPPFAKILSHHLHHFWTGAECMLFFMIGAEVDPRWLLELGGLGILILSLGLIARSFGVWISLSCSSFSWQEKLYCILSFIPKATVQAAIGGVALLNVQNGSLHLPGGPPVAEFILAMAVLGIVVTAPLGAWAMDFFRPILLKREG